MSGPANRARILLVGAGLAAAAAAAALWPEDAPAPVDEAVERQPAPADAPAVPTHAVPFPREEAWLPARADAGKAEDAGSPRAPAALLEALGIPPDAGQPDAGAPVDAGAPEKPQAGLAALDAGPVPVADAPEQAPGTDPRFGLRWTLPGHCGPGFEHVEASRRALLATFALTTLKGARFFHDPDIDAMRVHAAGDALARGRSIATGLLGREAAISPPDVFLYATREEMKKTSCVNAATAGYYDGAVHAAADDFELETTLIHETVHHVLNGLGVTKPMWLHEGLAMFAAQEKWWQDERLGLTRWLRAQHLPFEALALAFPHSSDELFAGAVYYQSFRMVEFVFSSSPDRGGIYRLVLGLRDGSIRAPTAFSQATGLSGEPLEQAWKRFLESR